jgi:hypothetical protein
MMNRFEERLNQITEHLIKSNAFLKPASWSIEQGVNAKTIMQEHLEGLFKLWGLSHQSELESVHERIDGLERALERSIESEAKLAEQVSLLEANIRDLTIQLKNQDKTSPSS